MIRNRLLPLLAVLLDALPLAASASARPASHPFSRTTDSCAAGYSSCRNSDLPSDFCCPTGQHCLALASNTTVLCCPEGYSCSQIYPISCNLSLQDADSHPNATVKTTALRGALAHCGDGTCCPFGYSCTDDSLCKLDEDQSAKPVETPSSSSLSPVSSSASPTSIATSTRTSPTAASVSSITTASPSPSPTSSPKKGTSTTVVAAACIAAVLLAASIASIAFVIFRRRRRRRRGASPASGRASPATSEKPIAAIISRPMVSEASTYRSDFARRSSAGGSGITTTTTTTTTTTNNNNNNNKNNNNKNNTNRSSHRWSGSAATAVAASPPSVRVPPIRGMVPARPDPPTVIRMTTFSDMLRSADLAGVARGEPFLPHVNGI